MENLTAIVNDYQAQFRRFATGVLHKTITEADDALAIAPIAYNCVYAGPNAQLPDQIINFRRSMPPINRSLELSSSEKLLLAACATSIRQWDGSRAAFLKLVPARGEGAVKHAQQAIAQFFNLPQCGNVRRPNTESLFLHSTLPKQITFGMSL